MSNLVNVGIVGRHVMCDVKRGEETSSEMCEVMACQMNTYTFCLLVATRDGVLVRVKAESCTLAGAEGDPYR